MTPRPRISRPHWSSASRVRCASRSSTRKPKVRAGEKDKARKALDAARKQEAKARAALEKVESSAARTLAEHEAAEKQASTLEHEGCRQRRTSRASRRSSSPRSKLPRREHAELQSDVPERGRRRTEARPTTSAGSTRELAKARRACDAQRDPLVSAGLDVPGIGSRLRRRLGALARWVGGADPDPPSACSASRPSVHASRPKRPRPQWRSSSRPRRQPASTCRADPAPTVAGAA